jgi:hypothetical protein
MEIKLVDIIKEQQDLHRMIHKLEEINVNVRLEICKQIHTHIYM